MKKNENITRAFALVHGILRDADNHFRTALAAAFLANALNDTIIVAPRFASHSSAPGNENRNCRDTLASDEANWICENQRPDTWRSGGAAVGSQLSSFDFMDEILRHLAKKDVFPNLKVIVVVGHSAGGQFVTRYEMLNQVQDTLGIPVSYVVANPSSYAYVDNLRPTASAFPVTIPAAPAPAALASNSADSGPAFLRYADAKNCTGYDTWPYGLKARPSYSSALTDEQITNQFVVRSVTYLLGEADVLPLGVFDTSCSAMAQGPTRLGRGLAFHKCVNEHLHAHHSVVVVPFCSHSQRCMFTSDVALPLIFPSESFGWFLCSPLFACHLTWSLPGLFLLRSRAWLLTIAAEGGLESAPASRFRGAYPHQLNSKAVSSCPSTT